MMKKRRCWETKSNTDEGGEENDLTRGRGRNPVLAKGFLVS
jgi:hypothetical protein